MSTVALHSKSEKNFQRRSLTFLIGDSILLCRTESESCNLTTALSSSYGRYEELASTYKFNENLYFFDYAVLRLSPLSDPVRSV